MGKASSKYECCLATPLSYLTHMLATQYQEVLQEYLLRYRVQHWQLEDVQVQTEEIGLVDTQKIEFVEVLVDFRMLFLSN